jgi:hypothetical protein
LSVYILMSFDFPFVRLFGVRWFCYSRETLVNIDHIRRNWHGLLDIAIVEIYNS